MKAKLTYTDNYALIVDESDIKEGDLYLSPNLLKKGTHNINKCAVGCFNEQPDCKKITWHLPLNGSPELEGVPLLPPVDNVRYDFAAMFYRILKETYPEFDEWIEAKEYNKAKEKYKFTEEDILEAIEYGYSCGQVRNITDGHKFIQSLQQPKMTTEFEFEMEDVKMLKKRAGGVTYFGKPKTITLPNGNIQAIGRYL